MRVQELRLQYLQELLHPAQILLIPEPELTQQSLQFQPLHPLPMQEVDQFLGLSPQQRSSESSEISPQDSRTVSPPPIRRPPSTQ